MKLLKEIEIKFENFQLKIILIPKMFRNLQFKSQKVQQLFWSKTFFLNIYRKFPIQIFSLWVCLRIKKNFKILKKRRIKLSYGFYEKCTHKLLTPSANPNRFYIFTGKELHKKFMQEHEKFYNFKCKKIMKTCLIDGR